MLKTKILSLFAATLATVFVACNDGSNSSTSDESTSTTTTSTNTTDASTSTATTTNTSNGDYNALADSARINSEAGNYLDPKTGKAIRITVDPQTGARTNAATGEPVWRYIDKRTWWVYGGDDNKATWDTMGTARMEGSKIMYRGENDQWTGYDERWKSEDETRMKEWKMKSGDTKIKVEKDGDMKIKTPDSKYKSDEEGSKMKTKDVKVKTDEDGTKIKENQ